MLAENAKSLILWAILVACFVMVTGDVGSYDLRALWMAGEAFASASFDEIYSASDPIFRMTPPASWIEKSVAEGFEGAIYPFIYPPIWAWFVAMATETISYDTFALVARALNAAMIGGCFYLAARISGARFSLSIYYLISLFGLTTSLVFLLPLAENQPQIAVSFLILLAIERSRAGAPISAGTALAIAASIKLYPILFAAIWLGEGKRRDLAAVLVVGCGLGLLSIAVAGWPLHKAFLNEMSAISGTLVYTYATYSIDSLYAHFFLLSDMAWIDTSVSGGKTSWRIAEKPTFLRVADLVFLAGVVAGLVIAARRGMSSDPLFWPAAIILVGLVGPLSWTYHYLPAFVFLPALFDRLPQKMALGVMAITVIPTSLITLFIVVEIPGSKELLIPANVLSLAFAACVFTSLAFRPTPSGTRLHMRVLPL